MIIFSLFFVFFFPLPRTEEFGGDGAGEMHGRARPSRALPEQGDAVRITSKGSDVGTHPLEGGDLVHETVVPGEPGPSREESKDPEAVVGVHEDHGCEVHKLEAIILRKKKKKLGVI